MVGTHIVIDRDDEVWKAVCQCVCHALRLVGTGLVVQRYGAELDMDVADAPGRHGESLGKSGGLVWTIPGSTRQIKLRHRARLVVHEVFLGRSVSFRRSQGGELVDREDRIGHRGSTFSAEHRVSAKAARYQGLSPPISGSPGWVRRPRGGVGLVPGGYKCACLQEVRATA
ncbi:hypothetical protein [Nocardia barduliensis]|uniref:hypothetical protein n=1 Tax=Nocardia barduliensis TaxID=2736643 RepID=UPI001571E3DD|nr:hypothetical protein [Nocardia barduliensis]